MVYLDTLVLIAKSVIFGWVQNWGILSSVAKEKIFLTMFQGVLTILSNLFIPLIEMKKQPPQRGRCGYGVLYDIIDNHKSTDPYPCLPHWNEVFKSTVIYSHVPVEQPKGNGKYAIIAMMVSFPFEFYWRFHNT